jgi:hypothetical protein
VRVDPLYAPSYTLYFDAQSFVLRGMDIANGRGGQGRLIAAARLPAAAVPPQTFTLNAPPTARVAPHEAVVAAAADLTAIDHPALALVSICNIPPGVLKAAMASGDKSPLTLCRATAPGMTPAALVAAVAAEEKARLGLAEGVAIGKITPAHEAAQLANLRTKLAMWVTKPLTD